MSEEQDSLPAYTVRVKPRGLDYQNMKEPIVILVDKDGNEAGRLRGIAGSTLEQTHDWPELSISFVFFEHEPVAMMPNPPEQSATDQGVTV